MPRSLIALLFLSMPLLEIAGFVVVGSRIGVLPTIGLVLASALLGAVLLRVQGLEAMRRIQADMAAGVAPGAQIVHGAMILFAAILLIVPGFISDIFGLLLFVPAVREALWSRLAGRVTVVRGFGARRGPATRAPARRVIDLDEGDYREIDADGKPDPRRAPD